MECRSLFISGGEPFLREDLPEILEHARRTGFIDITVITNGVHQNKDVLAKIKEDVDVIAISIDGYNSECKAYIRGEQRFEQLMQFVKAVKREGISAHFIPTIHSKNVDDVFEYAELAKKMDVTFNYSLLSCKYGDQQLDDLLPENEELESLAENIISMSELGVSDGSPLGLDLTVGTYCGAGVKEISIAADGTVYPCHMLHDKEFALGNVFVEDLADILGRGPKTVLAGLHINNFDDCSECEYGYLCQGGCRARSYYRYGDLFHKDAYCALMKTYYAKLGELLKEQFHG